MFINPKAFPYIKEAILSGKYIEAPVVIPDIFTLPFAEELYTQIIGLQYVPSMTSITNKYTLGNIRDVLSNDTSPINKWKNYLSSDLSYIKNLLRLYTKSEVFYITDKSLNVHKYLTGGFHGLHIDTATKIQNSNLIRNNIDKHLGFHVILSKGWEQGGGGELVFTSSTGKKITIQPIFNTMVIYSAWNLVHEVKEITQVDFERYVLMNCYYSYIN